MIENKLLKIDQLLTKELIVFMFKQKDGNYIFIFIVMVSEKGNGNGTKTFEFNFWKKNSNDQENRSYHKDIKNSFFNLLLNFSA